MYWVKNVFLISIFPQVKICTAKKNLSISKVTSLDNFSLLGPMSSLLLLGLVLFGGSRCDDDNIALGREFHDALKKYLNIDDQSLGSSSVSTIYTYSYNLYLVEDKCG